MNLENSPLEVHGSLIHAKIAKHIFNVNEMCLIPLKS